LRIRCQTSIRQFKHASRITKCCCWQSST
jgi:hypothetical protein